MSRLLRRALALLVMVAAAPALAQTSVSGAITANATWDAAGSPYIVTGRVTVDPGVTLTVSTNAEVRFNGGQSLFVEGTLTATGALFTSNVATPGRNAWDRIRVLDGGTATFTNSTIEYANRALELIEGGTVSFTGVTVRNVTLAIETQPASGNASSTYAVWSSGGFSLTDVTITDSYAVGYLWAPTPYTVSGTNAFTGNDFDALFVYFIAHTGTWTIPAGPTIVWWTVNSSISDHLVVEPGAVIKNRGQRRRVRQLTAIGQPANPIIFTGYHDDSVGGDSNNSTATPGPGQAGELEVVEQATVQYAEFRYGSAGRLRLDGADGAGLAAATVTDTDFTDNAVGLYAERVDLTLADNTFSGNTTYPLEAGIGLRGSVDPAANTGLLPYLPIRSDLGGARRDTLFDIGLTYVMSGAIDVDDQATLVVNPGVVMKGGTGEGINVSDTGTLLVAGTASDPVILTSIQDDSAGGDTNGDGNATTPGFNDWYGVLLLPGTTASLDHAEVRYASRFSHRYNGHFYTRGAISAFDADLAITDSRISDSSRGVVAVESALTVTDTEFANSEETPIAMSASVTPTFSGNTMVNPGFAALGVTGGPVTADATLSKRTFAGVANITYVLLDNLTVNPGVAMTVDPGVVVKTAGSDGIYVDGALSLAGTAAEPIVFTDRRDDSVGNPSDTNSDGNTTSPGAGSWPGILYRPTTDATASPVSNVQIRYARDGLALSLADLTVTDVEVSNVSEHGLVIDRDTAPTINGFTIRNSPVNSEPIVLSLEATPTLSNVSFVSTGSRGIALLEDQGTGLISRRTLLNDVTLAPRAIAGSSNVPYVIRSTLPVPSLRTLTVAPGTILKFGNFGDIDVAGALVADADGASPIVFTAFEDDSIGGDTNADGNNSSPSRGRWDFLVFRPSAIGASNILRNVQVRYGRYVELNGVYARFEDSVYEQMSEAFKIRGNVSPDVIGNQFLNISEVPVAISPFSTPTFSGNVVANVPTLALGLLGGTFVSDFTLSPRTFAGYTNITYVPVGGAYNVDPGATLTIPGGTTFKFNGSGIGITITGALKTTGTAQNPVVFTSTSDDRYGNPGDTNQNGDTPPSRSASVLINFTDQTDDANTDLDGLVLAHATTGIQMTNAAPTIRNSRFEFMEQVGINLQEVSNPTIQNNTFADFDTYGVPVQFSLASDFTASGNVIEGQTMEALGIRSETLVSDATLPRRSFAGRAGIPYYLDGTYTVGTSATLTIDPGVVIKSRGNGSIIVRRGFLAEGAAAPGDKIVFTSIFDDFYGGDTNRDSTATAPGLSQWSGITFADEAVDGLSVLDHVIFRNAVDAVRAESAAPTITNALFQNNRIGLRAVGAADPLVTDSDFDGHAQWAVLNDGSFTIDATNNWWGDDSGPTVAGNPGGTGDPISGSVSFMPFVGNGTQNPALGDVSLNGLIQAFDAAEILGHLVSPSLSPLQLSVADVSGNASVMAMDASLILQYIVGIIDAFPAESDARRRPVPPADGATLELGALAGAVGDTLRVPVTLSGAEVDVYAVELALRATGLTVAGLEAGPGAEGATAVAGASGGAGAIALAATEPIPGGAPVAFITVRLDAADARLDVDRAVVNETIVEAHAVDAEGPPPDAFGLAVTGANPFRGATALRVGVPEPAAVRVDVVDALGRRVAVLLDGDVPAGAHTVTWNAQGASPGVYFVRLVSGASASVERLVVVR